MPTIKLPKGMWTYDPEQPLGPEGGFGEVFLGASADGKPVAVKRLKLTAAGAAHRELQIAEVLAQKKFKHVMPVYDWGQDAESDYYFVVMPQAKHSLQQRLDNNGVFDSPSNAAAVLREIALGLLEVENLVHRDLKPGNVLWYESSWRVADFGIARFVEESTSSRTLKDCLSAPYAAPEQWRLERATSATDVYALGCTGYAVLTARPPFPGPSQEDYQEQHLHATPPPVPHCEPRLQSSLTMMLRKTPDARPSLARVVQLLEAVIKSDPPSSGDPRLATLASAGAAVAQQQAEEEVKLSLDRSIKEQREQLAADAQATFEQIREELFGDLCNVAPTAIVEDEARIRLGNAVLVMRLIEPIVIGSAEFARSKWDVVLGGEIAVRQDKPKYVWGSSLWYSKINPNDEYRWREVSYFGGPLAKDRFRPYEPYALTDLRAADGATAPDLGLHQIAWGPQPIDDEDLPEFKSRWAELLAKAAQRKLSRPTRLPLQ